MRIVFTGGGTGGHVLPNIAIVRALRAAGAEHLSVFYIGEKNSFEEEAARADGIKFFAIRAGKLRRYFDLRNAIDFFKVPLGFIEAFFILKKIRPQLVFAKGGYVSVPVTLAAAMLKIPVWLHESDASPGLSARICARFAEKIWLSFEEDGRFFKLCAAQKIEVIGNPIRSGITRGNKEKGYKITGFSAGKPVLLVMGGSLGAQSLNQLIYSILSELLKNYQVAHLVGRGNLLPQLMHPKHYKQFEFLKEELPHIYAIADAAVSRAGAGSIFELLACKIPMLLIPLPAKGSRGDQIENACVFALQGFARALDQDLITPAKLLRETMDLLENKSARKKMIFCQSRRADFSHAAEKIAERLIRDIIS